MHRLKSLAFLLFATVANFSAPSLSYAADEEYVPKIWDAYDGPKTGIAVLTFEDGLSTNPVNNYFDGDVMKQVHFGFGEGLSNMLVTTLMSTNRFDVTDKKIAKNIFELYSTDVAKKIYVNGKNSSLPKVPGIRYFVLGSITDFTDGSESKGGGIGFGGVKVGGGKSIASITMHMRIIDSTTGSVIYSGRLDGVAESKKGGIDLSGLGVDANFSASSKTPLGQATQKLLDSATDAIIAATM